MAIKKRTNGEKYNPLNPSLEIPIIDYLETMQDNLNKAIEEKHKANMQYMERFEHKTDVWRDKRDLDSLEINKFLKILTNKINNLEFGQREIKGDVNSLKKAQKENTEYTKEVESKVSTLATEVQNLKIKINSFYKFSIGDFVRWVGTGTLFIFACWDKIKEFIHWR